MELNGLSGVVITKLDVLDTLPVIKIAHAYEIDGERQTTFEIRHDQLNRARPVFTEFPGWEKPIGDARQARGPAGGGAQVPGASGEGTRDADRRGERGEGPGADDLDAVAE